MNQFSSLTPDHSVPNTNMNDTNLNSSETPFGIVTKESISTENIDFDFRTKIDTQDQTMAMTRIQSDRSIIEIDLNEYLQIKYKNHQYSYIVEKQQEQINDLNKLAERNYLLTRNIELLKKCLEEERAKNKRLTHASDDDEEESQSAESRMNGHDDKLLCLNRIHDSSSGSMASPSGSSSTKTYSEKIAASSSPLSVTHFDRSYPLEEEDKAVRSQLQSRHPLPLLVHDIRGAEQELEKEQDEEEEDTLSDLDDSESRENLLNLVMKLTLDLAQARSKCDHKDLCMNKIKEERDSLLRERDRARTSSDAFLYEKSYKRKSGLVHRCNTSVRKIFRFEEEERVHLRSHNNNNNKGRKRATSMNISVVPFI